MLLRILFICAFCWTTSAAKAQDSLTRFLWKVQRLIEGTIPADGDQYRPEEHRIQYFILDLRLDSAGKIKALDYFGKARFQTNTFINEAIARICKSNLIAKTSYTRILIPLVFVFQTGAVDSGDFPFLTQTMNKELGSQAFIAREVVIVVFDSKTRKGL